MRFFCSTLLVVLLGVSQAPKSFSQTFENPEPKIIAGSEEKSHSTGQPVRHQRRSRKDLSSGPNCLREKTLGSLPAGAPLPDIQIPQNDTITAEHAYEIAKKLLTNNCQIDATEYFERAIGALRKERGTYSKKLVASIVVDYGQLLRAHLGARKATELEKEFLSK